ncbi:MAG: ABC transporter ATP-binding protein [Anaerolineae bacterium]
MSRVLDIINLKVHFKIFEGEAQVLNGVDLHVDQGETASLVGETGCGKSVTIKTVLRILPIPPGKIVSGNVLYKGRNLLDMPLKELHALRGREIALIPQEPMTSLNPVFTVGEQLTELIKWQGRYTVNWAERFGKRFDQDGNREAYEKALALLERTNIPDPPRVMKSYPFELSGGMMQRVLIAMALAGDPSLLIADEPGTALDVTTQGQILRLLEERVIGENLAVLYITHNLGVARQLSQRIYVMYGGEVVEMAETQELFRAPQHPYTQGLMASIPKLTGGELKGIDGRVPDYVNPPPGCRFHPRCSHAMPICSQERPPLLPLAEGHLVACHLYTKEAS